MNLFLPHKKIRFVTAKRQVLFFIDTFLTQINTSAEEKW